MLINLDYNTTGVNCRNYIFVLQTNDIFYIVFETIGRQSRLSIK